MRVFPNPKRRASRSGGADVVRVAVVALLMATAGAVASSGHAPAAVAGLLDGCPDARDPSDGVSVEVRLACAIGRAAAFILPGHRDALIPLGTQLDAVEADGRVIAIWLTMPGVRGQGSGVRGQEVGRHEFWDDARVESIAAYLTSAIDFENDGVRIWARTNDHDAYRLLDSYVSANGGQAAGSATIDRTDDVSAESEASAQPPPLGDPPAGTVGHQPTGALSGVTVFCAAGHGWTAGASSWFLQRPLLLDMNEDYGNLEQLNYFVQQAYNAGATVVPFRPVGYQNIEVVLDNDDEGVTYSGVWSNSSAIQEYYENGATIGGVPYRFATAAAVESAVARFTPSLPADGFYPVYGFAVDGGNRVRQTYRVVHSGGVNEVTVDHRLVGKGWIWLGNYYFLAGTGGYVEVTNASPDGGVVIADAIRFGNGIGDIVRPGPGTVSGYPRDEECQRYWAHSEIGNNFVGLSDGTTDEIYDLAGSSDDSDNVGTGARWGRYMNSTAFNADRWRRIYIEFHSNAAGCGSPTCSAQGTVALVTGNATANQVAYATILGDEVEADMIWLSPQLETPWLPRSNPFNGSFGAISTTNNGDEFDATILEVAFHDNFNDANHLKSARVRPAVARASIQGIIKFLNQLPGSTIPLVFPPEPPMRVRAVANDGQVMLGWAAGPNGNAYGSPPTGYRVYRSPNGYGFDGGIDVGNVLTTTLTDVPAGEITYFRVTAVNAGGESLPTEVVAVRPAANGEPRVLIVGGYDRVDRHLSPTHMLPAGLQRRPIERRVNSFDYVVQHAEAIRDLPLAFDAVTNDALTDGSVSPNSYPAVAWFVGREHETTDAFSAAEQAILTGYLISNQGRLFASGSEIGRDLVGFGGGVNFFNNTLHAAYLGDDAGTELATGVGGSILGDVGAFSFAESAGAAYTVETPDRIGPGAGASSILNYVGGTGDSAASRYDAGNYRTIVFGMPFETLAPASVRAAVMARVLDDLLPNDAPFDGDLDGDIDLHDAAGFMNCFTGDSGFMEPFSECRPHDENVDHHVNAADASSLALSLGGPVDD